MDGNLTLGRGHSYLANGKDVQAAGSLKVDSQGYVRRIDNLSGHYTPSVAQTKTFPSQLESLGIRTKNAWLETYNINLTSSGYADLNQLTKQSIQLK